eukprot:scaffold161434_cov30-Tisochrysis_lutea.AAC.3
MSEGAAEPLGAALHENLLPSSPCEHVHYSYSDQWTAFENGMSTAFADRTSPLGDRWRFQSSRAVRILYSYFT